MADVRMDNVRMDKWLWAARFFKTRALAADACELGRVDSNGHRAKPAREVRLGDTLRVKTEAGEFVLEVLLLSEVRGPATVAQGMYRETDESGEARKKAAEERRVMLEIGMVAEGRPSKKDRRDIKKAKGHIHRF